MTWGYHVDKLHPQAPKLSAYHMWLDSGVQGQQLRSMLALVRWLQLYILADPAAAQPDVALDLQGVFNGAFGKAKLAAGGYRSCHA